MQLSCIKCGTLLEKGNFKLLPILQNKFQYNRINNMGAMIFWFIKLEEIIKLIQYAI